MKTPVVIYAKASPNCTHARGKEVSDKRYRFAISEIDSDSIESATFWGWADVDYAWLEDFYPGINKRTATLRNHVRIIPSKAGLAKLKKLQACQESIA